MEAELGSEMSRVFNQNTMENVTSIKRLRCKPSVLN
jgi:hypothetical protein